MKVLWSPSTGVIAYQDATSKEMSFRRLPGNVHLSTTDILPLSCVEDWEDVEGDLSPQFISRMERGYWRDRAVSLAECLLFGLDADLEQATLGELEELLQLHSTAEVILGRLLIAPIMRPADLARLTEVALASGFAAAGKLLEDLGDLQVLLRRFVNYWLNIPANVFEGLSFGKERAWILLTKDETLRKLLLSSSPSEFQSHWISFMAHSAPGDRAVLNKVCHNLVSALWPNVVGVARPGMNRLENEEEWELAGDRAGRGIQSGHSHWQHVVKQVLAIATFVSEGKDHLARTILDELVAEQRAQPEYAVKSLCNIAKHCKDLFRTDFEHICLGRAVELNPGDSWTLCQYGDHLKRLGNLEQAKETLRQALAIARSDSDTARVATASLASVYAEERNFEKALDTYRSIAGWDQEPSVRTAMGNVFRRMGALDRAQGEYDYVLDYLDSGTFHALAGKAEIAKRRGQLSEAGRIYESLLSRQRDAIGLLAYSHVLKMQGELLKAYDLADQAVQESKFSMQARIQRAAIQGLLGRETLGLLEIPQRLAKSGIEEWLQQYVRGLLLLKLKRYTDSQHELIERYKDSVLSSDSEICLRLAAALALLFVDDVPRAKEALSEMPPNTDIFTEYLTQVLRLHVAVAQREEHVVTALLRTLGAAEQVFPRLWTVVQEIRERNLTRALQLETVSSSHRRLVCCPGNTLT